MSYWKTGIVIAGREFPRFIGGPLDGITDSPFRRLVRLFSENELLYTEMRHVGTVANDKGKSKTLVFEQSERPINYQISVNNTTYIEPACQRILAAGVDMIDLNIGCPARNVIRSGSGSALMADLPRLQAVVSTLRAAISVPFTVKMRAGFKHKNVIDVALMMQDCGVDAIAIHPRLQTEMFSGTPDYGLVAEVKKRVTIPVIVSGGVMNWQSAQRAYEITGADGYLIGRGIWAKPWKLAELRAHSQGEHYSLPLFQVGAVALRHLEEILAYYGDHGLYIFRKHLPFYIKGVPSAAGVRQRLVMSNSIQEVKEGIVEFFGLK